MAIAILTTSVITFQMEDVEDPFLRLLMFMLILVGMVFVPILFIAVYGLILSLLNSVSEDQNTNEYDD
jgi:uncharacterized oligopeptide transporter (OPT) family protein